MKHEKYEIEIPNLPEGVKLLPLDKAAAVAYFDRYGRLIKPDYAQAPAIPVEAAPGYRFESMSDCFFKCVKILPKRVRIEFDMPEGYSGVRAVPFVDRADFTNWVKGSALSISILPEGE